MINSINSSTININVLTSRNIYAKNVKKTVGNNSTLNFKSKYIPKKPMALSQKYPILSAIYKSITGAFNKSCSKIDKYFEETKNIPAYIWNKDNKLINNPICKKHALILDNLNIKEKKAFVKQFCKTTGFPNLKEIQSCIDTEIRQKAEELIEKNGHTPLFMAYSSVSSAGKRLAIPGSDCDGLMIIVDRPIDYDFLDRGKVGNCINQRLINTTGKNYPEMFSIQEMLYYVDFAENIFQKIKNPQKIKKYEKNLFRTDKDFVKAGEFNIDIASKIKKPYDKNMVYLTGMFVEELRSGHIILNNLDKKVVEYIKNSALYKYSNLNRQEGFKDTFKPKLEARVEMCKKFKKMKDEEKFKICSEIFKSTLGIETGNTKKINEPCDMGNILEFVKIVTAF